MKREQQRSARRFADENEAKNGHETRKQNWSEQDRKRRKERRHPEALEPDEAPAPPFPRGPRI